MSKKKIAAALICAVCLSMGLSFASFADSARVVTLGVDLTPEQMDMMMQYFNVGYDEVHVIYINNDQEREHLSSYVPLEQIGSYTYSCAYVKPTESGGIRVKTANLSWVTCNMIASTLSTSGVTNCEVVAACPFQVSGTGALTGIIMAYETATGEELPAEKKDLAVEEMVITGELGDRIGQTDATAIVNEAKMEVLGDEIVELEEIQDAVVSAAADSGYELTDDEVDVLAGLLEKMAGQDYDYNSMQDTLEMVDANVSGADVESLDDAEDEEDPVYTEPAAEELTILDSVDDSVFGDDVISGSTDEKVVDVVDDENTDVYVDDTWSDSGEEVFTSETEELLNPDDLSDEDREDYDQVEEYCKKTFNDSDVNEEGRFKVPVDEDAAKEATEFVEQLFLSIRLKGLEAQEDYEPDEDEEVFFESDELNYIDVKMQELFLDSEGLTFQYYSEQNRDIMYEAIMRFFCELYEEDYPGDAEEEGLEELEDAEGFVDLDAESFEEE